MHHWHRMGISLGTCNICKSISITPSSSVPSKSAEKSIIKLLFLGLDNAGKTTTVMHLIGESVNDIISTVGFSNVRLKKYNRFSVMGYDLGGGPRIRGIWDNYYALIHGVVFVIDSTDISRILEVKEVMENLIQNDKIGGKPILILINKHDIDGAMDEMDVCKYINLEPLINKFKCPTRIESCSAFIRPLTKTKLDPSIEMGYQWLLKYIENNWKELNLRVQTESEQQYAAERKDIEERLKRFREFHQKNNDTMNGKDETLNGNPFLPIKELVKDLKQMNELNVITEAMKSDVSKDMSKISYDDEDDDERIEPIDESDNSQSIKSDSLLQGVDEVMKLFADMPNIKSNTQIDHSLTLSSNNDNISVVEIHHYNHDTVENKESDSHVQNDEESPISSCVTSPQNSQTSPIPHKKVKKKKMKVLNSNKVSPASELPPLKSKRIE